VALRERLGEAFLRSLPATPGVYLMLGADDELLYVGKAKSLRTRIRSYTRLDRDDDPRRISMIAKVHAVRWEEHPDEASAIARETELLRVLRPPFNYSHAARSEYLGIAVAERGRGSVRIRLATGEAVTGETLYGCFPFEARTPDGCVALAQTLYAAQPVPGAPRLPSRVIRAGGLDVRIDDDLRSALDLFLAGRSPRLVDALDEHVRSRGADVLVLRSVARDLETLRRFYADGPRTLRRLQLQLGSPRRGVTTDELVALMARSLCAHFGVTVDARGPTRDAILAMRADGLGLQTIAERLNRDRVPKIRGAGAWSAYEVSEVVREQIDAEVKAISRIR
jgi:predicted GIY-YIG superfamily endonuclease